MIAIVTVACSPYLNLLWISSSSLTPPENQEAPEIAVVPVLPAVAVPQAIPPQAIIAPGVIHITQDNAKAQPAQEAPAILLVHAPAVIQLDANEDAQIAQDIAITPQTNAAPAAAQQTQLDQCISPQDIRANSIALAARLARRTAENKHPKNQQLCCLCMSFIHTTPTSVELNTNSLTYALRRGLDPQGITI
ncbi:hypothetical protein FRACYDRAFT_241157 [Fragilariopsis cylindrus CCMP1102]|uniref:Uncharacterized protein n=1 Tax=Fragilariopsis cylindrus CCMP1102 TaxID=635003 RepID=A0A1E7F8X9_9STRA|nr:hypothetical protein FRACYDRAFT_241157 [Fragilariopsis cylindrus CCMP1102]|eukprot:OEU14606.1 hypothetical protein FRACYDRAFT_241157 [Fragilariopsis cylindrus CCMP1102]